MQNNPSLNRPAVALKRAINGSSAEVTAFPPEITRHDNITFRFHVSKKNKHYIPKQGSCLWWYAPRFTLYVVAGSLIKCYCK